MKITRKNLKNVEDGLGAGANQKVYCWLRNNKSTVSAGLKQIVRNVNCFFCFYLLFSSNYSFIFHRPGTCPLSPPFLGLWTFFILKTQLINLVIIIPPLLPHHLCKIFSRGGGTFRHTPYRQYGDTALTRGVIDKYNPCIEGQSGSSS